MITTFLGLFLTVGSAIAEPVAAAPAAMQLSKKGEDCPYCRNSPEIMKRAGLVTHGIMPFANTNNVEVEKVLAYVKDFYWLESEHFRVGISLPSYNVPERDKRQLHADLEELQKVLPSVNPKAMVFDPWLRVHVIAYRAEKFYKKFLEMVGLTDAAFGPTSSYGGKYMGEGMYLGEKEKYQLFFVSAKAPYLDFMRKYVGSEQDQPRRHNFLQQDSLWFGCHTVDDQLNRDLNLYSCMLHNLAHNFVDGFKHYSYEFPVWFTEGFAHWSSRTVTEDHVSYCFVETFQHFKQNGDNWPQELRRKLGTGGVSSLAELSRKKSFAELSFFDHITCWSLVDFMIADDVKKFAAYLDTMKGRIAEAGTNADGITTFKADGSNLTDVQRNAFKDIWGFTYAQYESAWRAWVAKTYPAK